MKTQDPIPSHDENGLPNPMAYPDGMKADLDSQFSDIQRKHAQGQRNDAINQEKLHQMRIEMVQKLFDMLKTAGVDPADPASVSAFLQKLASQNPDLLKLFEDAFNNLVPDNLKSPLSGNLSGNQSMDMSQFTPRQPIPPSNLSSLAPTDMFPPAPAGPEEIGTPMPDAGAPQAKPGWSLLDRIKKSIGPRG